MKAIAGNRLRPAVWITAVLLAGVTCTDGTGPRSGRAVIGLAPVLSPLAAAIYSNVVAAGLSINNVRLRLNRADGSSAKDTTITIAAGQDSVVIEMEVDVSGGQETLTAKIDLRDGAVVLFSGTQDVLAIAGGVPQGTGPTIKVEYSGPGAAIASVSMARDDTISFGDSVAYTASAKDDQGASVTDFALLWSLRDSTLGTVSSNGVFKAGNKRGQTYVIARTFTGVRDSAHVTVSPPMTKLVLVSGDAQSGIVGKSLAQPIIFEAQAADNLPVPKAKVNVAITAGGGILIGNPSVLTADFSGRVMLTLQLGQLIGTNSVQVSATGITSVSASATGAADTPKKLVMSQQPSTTLASGATLATQPKIQLQDQFGNLSKVAAKPVVAALSTPGGRTLGGTLTVNTDTAGVASFTNLSISGVIGRAVLKFTLDTLVPSTSDTITIAAGAAAKVTLATRPSAGALTLVPFAQQPVARIMDDFGNTVTSSSALVTVSPSAGYILPGTLTVAAASGIATFTSVAASGPTGNLLLTFASSGLTSDTATVAVAQSIGPPAHVVATLADSVLAAIDTIGSIVPNSHLPSVLVKDASNVGVPGITVKFRRHSGSGGLINGATDSVLVTTGSDGVAKLSSRKLQDSLGVDSLQATVTGIADTARFYSIAANGAPHHLAFDAQPAGGLAGVLIGVVVTVRDRVNNPTVIGYSTKLTLAIKAGTGTGGAVLGPVVNDTVTTTVGVAAFTVSIDKVGTGYQLTASASGLTPIESTVFDVDVGLPDHFVVIKGDQQAALKNAVLPDSMVVQLKDAVGNNVPGQAVLFARQGGGFISSATGADLVTDANGKIGRRWTLGSTGDQFFYANVGSVAVTLQAFMAETLSVVAQPPLGPQSGAVMSPQPRVALEDKDGRAVHLAGVQINASYQRDPVFQDLTTIVQGTTTGFTDANGEVQFTNLAIAGQTPTAHPQTVKFVFSSPDNCDCGNNPHSTFSQIMTLAGGPATQLTFNPQPGTVGANSPFGVTVEARDAQNNLATTFTGSVTIAIGTNPEGGTLTGTTLSANAVAGVATFTGLSINNQSSGYTLTATTSGLTSATSLPFDIAPPVVFNAVQPSVSASENHTCASATNGNTYCWGSSQAGALGISPPIGSPCDANGGDERCPVLEVTGIPQLASLVSGGGFSCGLSGGSAWCWGDQYALLGFGVVPSVVPGGVAFSGLAAGEHHMCGIQQITQLAFCWGYNGYGNLGIGATNYANVSDVPAAVVGGHLFSSLSANQAHTCGVTTVGDMYCWGYNGDFETGNTSAGTYPGAPVLVSGGLTWMKVAVGQRHTCGLRADSTAYCWGFNDAGNIGDGTNGTTVSSPAPVSGGLHFADISAGMKHTCAITAAGAAYCWGFNDVGQLGIGSTGGVSATPTAVSGGYAFAQIAVGRQISCGTTTTGSVYCWGSNSLGELGQDPVVLTSSNVPVLVPPPGDLGCNCALRAQPVRKRIKK